MSQGFRRNYNGNNYGYSKRSYNSFSPMMPASNRSYPRNNSFKRKYVPKQGPYRVLTSNQRHTNSVYPKPECKIFDCDFTAATPPTATLNPITNAGSIACINAIPTGTGVANFTGNQITVKSVAYRYELDLGTTPVPTSGRVMLIYDKQPNGALPAYTDIFQTSNYLAFGNVNSRERFVILRNDQFSLSQNGDQTLFFERYVKVNMTTTFANGSTGTTPPLTGALLIVCIADQATGVNQPRVAGNCRIRYFDN